MTYYPEFLRYRDPEPERNREWMQRAYQQRGEQDRAMQVNYGYGSEPFTVEDALAWAERRAQAVLP